MPTWSASGTSSGCGLLPSLRSSTVSPGIAPTRLPERDAVDQAALLPGPVTEAISSRIRFGPIEYLRHHDRVHLAAAQKGTLSSPTRRYSFAARIVFRVMDALCGPVHSLEKFRVLGLVARVPFQARENLAHAAVTHTARHRARPCDSPGAGLRLLPAVVVLGNGAPQVGLPADRLLR